MNIKHENFVGVYSNVFQDGFCQYLIDKFEVLANGGVGADRKSSEGAPSHIKNDYQIYIPLDRHAGDLGGFGGSSARDFFFAGLQRCFEDYVTNYSVLKAEPIRCVSMKMQRTNPGGGYHVWHSEQGPREHSGRVLVYILYLNTLDPEHAGETEFLYQQARYRPIENTMLLWPAAFTHAHRGNTVFGDKAKYVVTGWFYYD